MDTPPLVPKALAYLVHEGRLCVLRERDYPEEGLCIPGGTLEPGELPVEGVLREALEETGLTGLEVVAFLGEQSYDMRPHKQRIEQRYYFHLRCTSPPPEEWQHHEMFCSEGKEAVVQLFSWREIDGSDLGLSFGRGYLLAEYPWRQAHSDPP